ncbi:MAG: PKD domain-containing protein [Bacteroidetes bacterium]|nr:PKD domain-containing protein [Bacteroidota bacterium]
MFRRILFLFGTIFPLISQAQNAQRALASCRAPYSKVDLDINNVRAKMMNAGDMWWDLSNAKYEIPKGSGKNSVFSGGVWMGGVDDGGQLCVAAMTYRQSGLDFFSGPLDTTTATTFDTICDRYDYIWKVNRADVEAFRANYQNPAYTIPEDILNWPGNGDAARGHAKYLAPFTDVDGDGIYNARNGDYPAFALNGNNNCDYHLLGDQSLWWVFNDKGGVHSETGGQALGVEVHATAFAYKSSNEHLNNATFIRYKIINRSEGMWYDFWFGQYMDVDVGDYLDDYVGCDVARGLGYGYNGDVNDGATAQAQAYTYGAHPPAVGVDFLKGTRARENDAKDNDHDYLIDEPGETHVMSMFKYYDGDWTVVGDPENHIEFYYYIQGFWRDGAPQTYGGNGYGGTLPCMYMFPGISDIMGWGTGGVQSPNWTEASVGNAPSDRRFIASVGPTDMEPGEVEIVTVGVPWARDTNGTNLDAITKLQEADDYIQQLFDNCFNTLSCTDRAAPEFSVIANLGMCQFTAVAKDGTYEWDFGDGKTSTDKHPMHEYKESGEYIVCLTVRSACDTATVCDTLLIEVYEHECGPSLVRYEGKGNGIMWLDMTKASIDAILSAPDHQTLYPEYEGVHGPVKVTYEDYHQLQDGEYRIAFDSVTNTACWRLWKVGDTDTIRSYSAILYKNKQYIPQYGIAITVQQVAQPGSQRNPDNNGVLGSSMVFSDPSKNWLSGIPDDDYYGSANWIRAGNRSGTGLCVAEFNDRSIGSVFIDNDEHYEKLVNGTWGPYRLCADNISPTTTQPCYETGPGYPNATTTAANRMENLANVDVVFTADKTKWSRCVVFEIGSNTQLNENATLPFFMRSHASVDKEGRTVAEGALSDPNNPEAADYIGATGMGWFPGYAINVETGERLNIAFAENSALVGENGRDMLWNPTASVRAPLGATLWGGMHYIYVFNHNGDVVYTTGALTGQLKDVPRYDAGKMMYTIMNSTVASSERTEIFRDACWVNVPVLTPGHQLLETDVTVKLRIQKPYAKYVTSTAPMNNDFPLYGFTIDKANFDCNIYEGSVQVFPNPFIDECTILYPNTGNFEHTLELYDLKGRLVRRVEGIVEDRIVIVREGLLSGVYIYVLSGANGNSYKGKIIVR